MRNKSAMQHWRLVVGVCAVFLFILPSYAANEELFEPVGKDPQLLPQYHDSLYYGIEVGSSDISQKSKMCPAGSMINFVLQPVSGSRLSGSFHVMGLNGAAKWFTLVHQVLTCRVDATNSSLEGDNHTCDQLWIVLSENPSQTGLFIIRYDPGDDGDSITVEIPYGPDGVSLVRVPPGRTSPVLVTETGLDFELRISQFSLNQQLPSVTTLCESVDGGQFHQSDLLSIRPSSDLEGCLPAMGIDGGGIRPSINHINPPRNLNSLSLRQIYFIYGSCDSSTQYFSPTYNITGVVDPTITSSSSSTYQPPATITHTSSVPDLANNSTTDGGISHSRHEVPVIVSVAVAGCIAVAIVAVVVLCYFINRRKKLRRKKKRVQASNPQGLVQVNDSTSVDSPARDASLVQVNDSNSVDSPAQSANIPPAGADDSELRSNGHILISIHKDVRDNKRLLKDIGDHLYNQDLTSENQ